MSANPTPAAAQNNNANVAAGGAAETPFPCEKSLVWAARLAIEQDKPIMLDYYSDTAQSKAFLGEHNVTNERVLIKNAEEFTSPIVKLYRADSDIIVITENSVYIVSGRIQKKTIR
jgi:hypothetical protein